MSDIDSTPKWAREARDHLINLSARLDDTEAYVRSLEAVRVDLLNVLQEAVNKGYMWDHDPELWAKAGAAIAKAKGD